MMVTAAARCQQAPFCPCCDSRKALPAFQKSSVDYFYCVGCGMTFIFPWPDEQALQGHYEDYGQRYYLLDGLKDFLLSTKHYEREIRIVSRVASKGALLDVGCSVGGFVKAATDLGYDAEGIDISPTSVAVGQAIGLQVRAGDFLTTTFARKFDVITMWATLEHLPKPNRYIEHALRQLRPGGTFFASVPNFSGITQRLIGHKDRYVGIDHLNYWTARGFVSYIAGFGLDILGITTFAFNPITLLQDWRLGGDSCDCEQMARSQKRTASLKRTLVQHAHRATEKLLNTAHLGDVVAIAARLPIAGA